MANGRRNRTLRGLSHSEDSPQGSAFRRILASGDFAARMFSFIPSEAIVDIVGYGGFDYVIFDTEHASCDIAMIERLVRATEAAGIASARL